MLSQANLSTNIYGSLEQAKSHQETSLPGDNSIAVCKFIV